MERVIRGVLLLVGLAAGAYGAVQLLDLGWTNLRGTLVWLAGGVLLHDGILVPLTLLVGLVAGRALGGRLPAPLVVAALVLGSVSLVAVPVLGRFGARADNATLLDRNYLVGWLVFAGIVAVATVAVMLARAVRSRE